MPRHAFDANHNAERGGCSSCVAARRAVESTGHGAAMMAGSAGPPAASLECLVSRTSRRMALGLGLGAAEGEVDRFRRTGRPDEDVRPKNDGQDAPLHE